MADKMATRMPSFTLQPHHSAISHGIARMQGDCNKKTNYQKDEEKDTQKMVTTQKTPHKAQTTLDPKP